MVIFLVVNLCKMFNLSIVTQVKELEDLKNKGVFHEAAVSMFCFLCQNFLTKLM